MTIIEQRMHEAVAHNMHHLDRIADSLDKLVRLKALEIKQSIARNPPYGMQLKDVDDIVEG